MIKFERLPGQSYTLELLEVGRLPDSPILLKVAKLFSNSPVETCFLKTKLTERVFTHA